MILVRGSDSCGDKEISSGYILSIRPTGFADGLDIRDQYGRPRLQTMGKGIFSKKRGCFYQKEKRCLIGQCNKYP